MSRKATIVQVFIASPSDVCDERDLLAATILELNRTWSKALGIIFELVRWEDNVPPALGDDAQAVINSQVGDEYDVFIGILWGKFGTPTQRAASGTMEEFERAYDRFLENGSLPEIMIYFKDQPLPPSKVDPAQLEKVQQFKKKIEGLGVYSIFDDAASFESSVRAHLSALAQKFSIRAPEEVEDAARSVAQEDGFSEDDLGYLDYVEIYDSRMHEMSAIVSTMTAATELIGEQMNARSLDLEGVTSPSVAKKIIKKSADDMESYADILSANIPLMSASRETAMSALSGALVVQAELGENRDQLIELRDGVTAFRDATFNTRGSLSGFRDVINGMPRMTSDLNRAKRRVVAQLDLMDMEHEKTLQNVKNILESVDKLLE
ncbi:DUF4062 domain-containing protein [Pseudoxanthomonas sp.]|jgi:hypothetical protein|uniref:DUF4062 domain-containing protein n=1 Tax=Pseudoxanthomonas sp. TaxID=1871049 RepID=UPI002FDF4B71